MSPGSRSAAEWVTFAISTLVVAAVVGLVAWQAVGADAPPQLEATSGATRQSGSRFHLPVTVTNRGDQTAADVQVTASFTDGGETVEGQQEIDFLSGGESHELVFVFDSDPRRGEVEVRITGYSVP
jgi:uncharacterized protein (TIGR02588 family)